MTDAPDILKRILQRKVEEIIARCERISLVEISKMAADAPPPRDFVYAIERRIQTGQIAVIAELKKASPSKGLLRTDFNPSVIAQQYVDGGATCLSVLTDVDFFQGSDSDLQQARAACTLPILRKDFIIDAYQIYEARALGADCILLIVSALGDAQLHDLAGLAYHLDMSVLVEVHDQEELERALLLNNPLIGINNRNLHTFDTRLETTEALVSTLSHPHEHIIISESGIYTAQDIARLRKIGVHTFLIGESLIKAPHPGEALQALLA